VTPEQNAALSILGSVVFVVVLAGMLWKLRQTIDRLDVVEEDAELDRRMATEDRRALLHMIQLQDEFAILDTAEPDRRRLVVSEWTRPDWRDERIPEPYRVTRGIVPW
jgi:hypothetical protein